MKGNSDNIFIDEYEGKGGDPNDIHVCIPNSELPIIIPFGPRCCGKTMMIRRLCLYLYTQGHRINPEHKFRWDQRYQFICDEFYNNLWTLSNATSFLDVILLEVIHPQGYPICYLLDVDGDCYFDPNNPNAPYPTFIHQIIYSPNPKQFIYFVEPNWADCLTREHYVSSINRWQMHFDSQKNTAIILYNKIDKQPQFILPNNYVNYTAAVRDCQNLYPRLFHIFRKNIPFRWFYPYRVKFVPFTSGTFGQTPNGITHYTGSGNMYPEQLWKAITKAIRKF